MKIDPGIHIVMHLTFFGKTGEKTDKLITFQPCDSSSTIEDFSKQYSRTLKNYSNMLQDYSSYYSQLQSVRGHVGHAPRIPILGRIQIHMANPCKSY
jgi:hypothetical protein